MKRLVTLEFLQGYRTYIVAVLMLIHAGSGYLLGREVQIDWELVLEAFGLMSLRKALG